MSEKLLSCCRSGGYTGRRTDSMKLSQGPGPGQSKQVFIAGTGWKLRQSQINSFLELAWLWNVTANHIYWRLFMFATEPGSIFKSQAHKLAQANNRKNKISNGALTQQSNLQSFTSEGVALRYKATLNPQTCPSLLHLDFKSLHVLSIVLTESFGLNSISPMVWTNSHRVHNPRTIISNVGWRSS